MHRIIAVALALMAAAAFAQEAAPSPATAPNTTLSATTDGRRTMKPLQLDVRATGDTDILLLYVDVGVTADVGLLPVGPGTLTVGASADYGFCGSFCWIVSAASGLDYWQNYLQLNGRLGYHFGLPETVKIPNNIDFYGLVFGGPVLASMGLKTKDNSVRVEGNDFSFGVGAGGGVQYFFNNNFFGGAEATFRYAAGRYTWKATAGQYSVSESEASWSLSGFNLKFNVGARFP